MSLPYGINSPLQAFVGPDADKSDLRPWHAGFFYLAIDTGVVYQAQYGVAIKSGAAASISAATATTMTVAGLVGMVAADVGRYLSLSGSVNPENNGSFLITSFIDATSVVVANTAPGVAPDAGPLDWQVLPGIGDPPVWVEVGSLLDTLTVTGDATIGGDLTVGDDLAVGDDATIAGDLTVSGNTTLGVAPGVDTTTVNGPLAVAGAATTLSGTLGVTGLATLNGGVSTTTVTASGDITTTGTLIANGNTELGNAITDTVDINGNLRVTSADTSGVPGDAVINAQSGRSAVAIGSATIVITSSYVTAASHVFAVVSQAAADATLLRVERVSAAAGAFTIHGTAAATAATQVDWFVVSPTLP